MGCSYSASLATSTSGHATIDQARPVHPFKASPAILAQLGLLAGRRLRTRPPGRGLRLPSAAPAMNALAGRAAAWHRRVSVALPAWRVSRSQATTVGAGPT